MAERHSIHREAIFNDRMPVSVKALNRYKKCIFNNRYSIHRYKCEILEAWNAELNV